MVSKFTTRLLGALLSAVLFFITEPAIAQAQSQGKVMLVLDASGSMWGRVDDREKILIAREVVGDMLDHWDSDLALGLVAYGHRTRGECNDIETLVPVGGDLNAIRNTVDRLQPRGKTPLSAAVKQAAEHLRFTEDKATVILVSDGKETCDLDPCAVGRSLEQSGVDFTAHVIGFDISAEDRAGLECLASETGGQYFDAQHSEDLRVALEQAVEQIKAVPDTVVARLGEGGAVISGLTLDWRITGADGSETVHTGAQLALPLEPGDYKVEAQIHGVSGNITAEVTLGESREHEIVLPAGSVTFAANAEVAGEPVDRPEVSWSVSDADEEVERIAFQGPGEMRVMAAGSYRVVGEYEGLTRGREFVLNPGDSVAVDLEFSVDPATLDAAETALESEPVAVTWTGPDGDGDYITVVPLDAPQGEYRDYAYTRQGNPATVVMPDEGGEFELRYVSGNGARALARRMISVEKVMHSLDAPDTAPISSSIDINWQGADGEGDWITVVAPDAGSQDYTDYFYTAKGTPGQLTLPDDEGEYEIRYVSGQSKQIKARRSIIVSAVNTTLGAPLSAPMGREIEIVWQGPDGNGDYITVVTPDAEDRVHGKYAYTRKGSPLLLVMPDTAGDYEIRYVSAQSGSVLARHAISITGVETTLDAPESTPVSQVLSIPWQGPDGKGDYLTVVTPDTDDRRHGKYVYTRKGSPAALVMPDTPGDYEIRYVSSQSGSVLARRPIRVEPVAVVLDLPEQVPVSTEQAISWQGPDGQNDYVTVVSPDTEDSRHGKYTYTRKGSPLQLQMPDTPGQYEVRYISAQSSIVLGRKPVEVIPVAISLIAPAAANIGEMVEVIWEGPNGKNDFITVVPVTAEETKHGKSVYTRKGNPVKLAMPDAAGLYELRYVSAQSGAVLLRTPIEIHEVTVSLDSLSIGAMNGKMRVHWQGPASQNDRIVVASINDADNKWLKNARAERSPLDLGMPGESGIFEIRYVTGQSQRVLSRRLVEVVPEEEYLDRMAAMPGGTLRLSALKAGVSVAEGVNWQVYAIDGRPPDIQRSSDPVAEFSLPMGLYRANLSTAAGSLSEDVILDSGQTLDKTLILP